MPVRLGGAYIVARAYAVSVTGKKVFQWLNRDYVDHSGWLPWIQTDFEWE